ncbi:MAG: DEAD/DEAH box helicase [Gammaproteobacteria bacterium]|nr:MAG: DEAD/DEAH box helicase [Gammaproteobacteria bacterium]
MNFASLGLAPELLHAIKVIGYQQMTPIQQQAIPIARRGSDMLATAQTGTGKTAAYALPLLQHMVDKPKAPEAMNTRMLVLAPTRELVQQVAESIQQLSQFLNYKIVTVYGGVKASSQATKLRAGTDILVATPGRLLEHVEEGNINLAKVEFAVLDEADRMLDMGFVNDIHKLLTGITRKHQTLFFSATSSPLVTNLAKQAMNKPVIVAVSKRNAVAETIEHLVYPVDDARKYELFVHLLRTQNWYQVMAFSSTREEADKLIAALKEDNVDAAVIHSEKTQGSRRRALQDFKDGKLQVLVATEVAARGLDIQGLDFVVNLNLPFFTEDYVHRIGRTGRAGAKGTAISFVCPAEEYKLTLIEDLIGSRIKRLRVKGFDVTELPPTDQRKVKAAPASKKAVSRADKPAQVRRGGGKTANIPAKKSFPKKPRAPK